MSIDKNTERKVRDSKCLRDIICFCQKFSSDLQKSQYMVKRPFSKFYEKLRGLHLTKFREKNNRREENSLPILDQNDVES